MGAGRILHDDAWRNNVNIQFFYNLLYDDVARCLCSIAICTSKCKENGESVEYWREQLANVVKLNMNSFNASFWEDNDMNRGFFNFHAVNGSPFGKDKYGFIMVYVDALIEWLQKLSLSDMFFNPANVTYTGNRSFMDANHPRYSPELALAVTAWEAFDDKQDAIKNEISEWCLENAKSIPKLENGISDDASKNIASIVGWKKAGRRVKNSNDN